MRVFCGRKPHLIYIAGPYSDGEVAENVRRACMVGNILLSRGYIPFIPHLSHLWHLMSPKAYEEWLRIDLSILPRMDAVLRLPGRSVGADREVALAKRLGIPVYHSVSELEVRNGA